MNFSTIGSMMPSRRTRTKSSSQVTVANGSDHESSTTVHLVLVAKRSSQWVTLQRRTIAVNPYIIFGDLKALAAAALNVMGSIDLSIGSSRQRVLLSDNDTIFGTIQNQDELYLEAVESYAVPLNEAARFDVHDPGFRGLEPYRQNHESRCRTSDVLIIEAVVDNGVLPLLESEIIHYQPPSSLHESALHAHVYPNQCDSDAKLAAVLQEQELHRSTPSKLARSECRTSPCRAKLVQPPKNDLLGEIVARGTMTQYGSERGESACTSICVVAAAGFLSPDRTNLASTHSSDLDQFVNLGIVAHQDHGLMHSCLDDLWNLPSFSNVSRSVRRGPTFTGIVNSSSNGFQQGLESAIDFGIRSMAKRMAVIVIKPPESILCIIEDCACGTPWFLFDSHGQSHDSNKVVYLKRFDSTEDLALGLNQKFPGQMFASASVQEESYNMFELHPIISCECPSFVKGADGIQYVDDNKGLTQALVESTRPYNSVNNVPCAPNESCCDMRTSPGGSPQARQHNPSPSLHETHIVVDDYEDPVLGFIMADPVNCDDGFTYERTTIEKHFQCRREIEEQRLIEVESQQRVDGTGSGSSSNEARCCGPRREIRLTSPLTGEDVSDHLVPNKILEQQIVRYIETNAIHMSEEDVAEWNDRRKQKKRSEQQRLEERRRKAQREEEMRINREEAERRREEEGLPDARDIRTHPQPHAEQVRIDRRLVSEECVCEEDLGLSVAICNQSNRIPLKYIASGVAAPRCMVACCARRINDSPRWCARCGRLACSICLGFMVTNIANKTSSDLHSICGECVSHIVDVLDQTDIDSSQTRAIIMRIHLTRYMATLTNQAAELQDCIAKWNETRESGPILEGLHEEIANMMHTRDDLLEEIQIARGRADEARLDDGMSAGEATSLTSESCTDLREICEDLEQQYSDLQQQSTPDDEIAQLERAQALSDITNRLEEATFRLVQRESTRGLDDTGAAFPSPQNSGGIGELEAQCTELQQEYLALCSSAMSGDEEEQLEHATAISVLTSKLDRAQLMLAEARSTQTDKPSAIERFFARLEADQNVESHERKRGLFKRQKKPSSSKLRSECYDDLISRLGRAIPKFTNGSERGAICEHENSDVVTTVDELLDIMNQLGPFNSRMGQDCKDLYDEASADLRVKRDQITSLSTGVETEPIASKVGTAVQDLEQVQREFLQMSDIDVMTLSNDNALDHIMRLTELEEILMRAANSMIVAEDSSFSSVKGSSNSGVRSTLDDVRDENNVDTIKSDLAAIGERDENWRLPLGLSYPTTRMVNQLEMMKNTLQLRLTESQRRYDAEVSQQRHDMIQLRDELEEEISRVKAELEDAQASAAAEEDQQRQRLVQRQIAEAERARQRDERRRRDEEERQERERLRLEREQRAREETERMRQQHAADEEATRAAFAQAVGNEGNAATFGGTGDLRMCKICKSGPYENLACSDLEMHNDTSTTYKGRDVASTENPNACKHCGWFDGNWHNWPYWDGISGPH